MRNAGDERSADGWLLDHGMEQEGYYDPIYYSGGGQFYEPQIIRGLSMIGALGRESPAGGGGGAGAAAGAGAEIAARMSIAPGTLKA